MLKIFEIFEKNKGKEEKKESNESIKEILKETQNIKICADVLSLIHLAKIGIIDEVSKNFKIIITNKIKEEIEKELKENENVAKILNEIIKNNGIIVEYVNYDEELLYYGLRGAELEVVECFKEKKCDIILSDDGTIRDNREILDLKVISTPSFILYLTEKKILNKKEARNALVMLRSEKWFTEWIIDECIRRVSQ
ncbi:MAG: hypothetical protein ACK4YO_03165 [Candidatus Altarchaeaceae archaeon]